MRVKAIGGGLLLSLMVLGGVRPGTTQQKKDYLTQIEADKIRDAETPDLRIRLFLSFAADRIKKFQYELARPSPDRQHAERLNSLLNAYAGCVDDAADLIELAIDKQYGVHKGIKEMQTKGKEFLAYLKELAAKGPQLETYKDNLDDAIESTQDAIRDAERATGEIAAPPVRRRP